MDRADTDTVFCYRTRSKVEKGLLLDLIEKVNGYSRIQIKRLGRAKKLRIQSTERRTRSQAGLIPVVKFLQDREVFDALDTSIAYKRWNNDQYQLSDVMYLTILGVIAGATSLLKVVAVWSYGVLRTIAGWPWIPDATTFGRIFKEVSVEQISLMETLQHRLRSGIWRDALRAGTSKVGALRQMWIDVDSTVDTVFGHQEGAAKGYNPHKRGALSYHPIMAFCCETKDILQAWLRSGNAYTSNGIVEFMKQLPAHLPNRTRVVFRSDSGFFVGSLLELLESRKHGYLVKVKLKNFKELMGKQVWTPIPNQSGWEQCQFEHECSGWKKPRRFVAVRVEKEQAPSKQQELFDNKHYDYFCYVTTQALSPWDAHKKYGERATCETWVEESKSQMGIGHIRTSKFVANAALFQCAVLAYNVIRWMALMSGNAKLRQSEITTIHIFLIRVAGKLVTGSRRLTPKTLADLLYQKEWAAWVAVGLPP